MNKKEPVVYRIWMEEIDDLEEGYCCGHSERSNSAFHRTEKIDDADRYDLYDAVITAREYNLDGYPCKIYPEPTQEEIMKVLFPSNEK